MMPLYAFCILLLTLYQSLALNYEISELLF